MDIELSSCRQRLLRYTPARSITKKQKERSGFEQKAAKETKVMDIEFELVSRAASQIHTRSIDHEKTEGGKWI